MVNSAALYTVIAAIIGAIVAVLIERLLTWHGLKVKTIQKRNEEFIKFTKDYYIPLATIVVAIKNETHPKHKVRPKVLFFFVAKYLSFFKSMRDKGIWYFFPKYSQELKIGDCSFIFYVFITYLIFKDDQEVIEHLIDHYSKKLEFFTFIKDVEKMPEYKNFEYICTDEELRKKLYSLSN